MNEELSAPRIIARCIADFVRRGGVTEANVTEVVDRIIENLRVCADLEIIHPSLARHPAWVNAALTPASAESGPKTEYHYSDLELKLRAECEAGYSVGPKADMAVSITGETFTEIANPNHERRADEPSAFELALVTFRQYAVGKSGTIYWRVYPEILKGKFYMRLLISDMPAIKKADAA